MLVVKNDGLRGYIDEENESFENQSALSHPDMPD
jgi:hypothetical protein